MEEPGGRRLRIVFVTPDEPSVMPAFFERAIPRLRGEVAAVAVVSPIYKKYSWLRQARRFVHSFGPRDFLVEAAHYGYHRAAGALSAALRRDGSRSVRGICRARGVPVLSPEDVNAPEFLDTVRGIGPDLVVSVSCPQIFGRELLGLPRLGCVNVHSSLLPNYRGMLPTFWVLARGESTTGVTVHFMNEGIDGGAIIAQRVIPIAAEETLHSLMRKCKAVAADLVLEAVDGFRHERVPVRPNPAGEGTYFSFPERQDVRRFRAAGRRMR
jgi:methionyl-tRNA formyltransferase